jgi:hypothetical protein
MRSELAGCDMAALATHLVSLKRLLSAIFQVIASVVFGQTVLEKRRRGSELGSEGSAGGRLGHSALSLMSEMTYGATEVCFAVGAFTHDTENG